MEFLLGIALKKKSKAAVESLHLHQCYKRSAGEHVPGDKR